MSCMISADIINQALWTSHAADGVIQPCTDILVHLDMSPVLCHSMPSSTTILTVPSDSSARGQLLPE